MTVSDQVHITGRQAVEENCKIMSAVDDAAIVWRQHLVPAIARPEQKLWDCPVRRSNRVGKVSSRQRPISGALNTVDNKREARRRSPSATDLHRADLVIPRTIWPGSTEPAQICGITGQRQRLPAVVVMLIEGHGHPLRD